MLAACEILKCSQYAHSQYHIYDIDDIGGVLIQFIILLIPTATYCHPLPECDVIGQLLRPFILSFSSRGFMSS